MDFPSIQAFFTPTVLFLLLNLIIGTIAVISNLYRHRQRSPAADRLIQQQDAAAATSAGGTIARSSSSNVLELVRSIGLFRFRSGDLPPIEDFAASHQESTVDDDRNQDHDDDHQQQQQQFRRIRSESASEPRLKKKEEAERERAGSKMKKSVSAMTSSWRLPAARTETEWRPAAGLRREASVDEEVDAKAEDFINRFRQQLNLQRLDSILRFKEMLTNSK